MSLRARLLLSIGALVAVALVVSGALVVGFTRAGLVRQVDDDLRSAVTRRGGPGEPGPGRGNDPTGRRIAYILMGPGGRVLAEVPSGSAGGDDPLPTVPAAGELATAVNRIIERPAVSGDLSYRTLVLRGQNGAFAMLAAPLSVVDAPIRE